jgi:hypothetical protein
MNFRQSANCVPFNDKEGGKLNLLNEAVATFDDSNEEIVPDEMWTFEELLRCQLRNNDEKNGFVYESTLSKIDTKDRKKVPRDIIGVRYINYNFIGVRYINYNILTLESSIYH